MPSTEQLKRAIESMYAGGRGKNRALAHKGQAGKANRARRAANRVAVLSRRRNRAD